MLYRKEFIDEDAFKAWLRKRNEGAGERAGNCYDLDEIIIGNDAQFNQLNGWRELPVSVTRMFEKLDEPMLLGYIAYIYPENTLRTKNRETINACARYLQQLESEVFENMVGVICVLKKLGQVATELEGHNLDILNQHIARFVCRMSDIDFADPKTDISPLIEDLNHMFTALEETSYVSYEQISDNVRVAL
jgi:hypothetical protein